MSTAFKRLGDRAPISLYSAGTFQFAGKRHKSALLVSPEGVYDWPPQGAGLDEAGLLGFLGMTEGLRCDLLLIGTGFKPLHLRKEFRDEVDRRGLGLEAMDTPAAIRTYNILLAENRRFLAALLPA